MAVQPSNVATLADVAKAMDPDGSPARVAEVLTQHNEILQDVLWKQGNLPTGHRTTIRTGLPTAYWRLINQGVPPSKAKTEQVDETCALLESWSEVDAKLVELNGNSAAYRIGQARPHMIAMDKEFNNKLFYGDQAQDARIFTGLSPRYDNTGESAENVYIADSSPTANKSTSIWLVVWGENTVYCIYPKNSTAGLKHKDLGLRVVESAAGLGNGNRLEAYSDKFEWDCGMVVEDWRYAARAANIDVTALDSLSGAADLRTAFIKLLHAVEDLNMGRAAFYVNRTVAEHIDLQGTFAVGGNASPASGDVKNVYDSTPSAAAGSYSNYQGAIQASFRGIPIRRCDAIKSTEAALS